ncbi:phage tail protein [Paracoccus sp. KR1-242]|uniref:phage tail protein n=1 Tax=Paracoccus sp. KR1-242 TaxID=3410028 RepID=UPI003C0E388B
MLMLLGPLLFEVQPFNLTDATHSYGASHVEKPVLGGRQPLEYTGEETESWSFRAILFPQVFGGEDGLTLLKIMSRSGLPQYMMRGDGSMMGWMVVTSVTERSSYLDRSGVGKVIEIDINVSRSDAPTAQGYFEGLQGLFGGLF